jgi:hypothetical protein
MKQKNILVNILIFLIFCVTIVYVVFSLQEKEDPTILLQETSSQPASYERTHGTIQEVKTESNGVYISLLTKLPVSTDSLTPEEYEKFTPETFPKEEKQWKFFIPLADSANSASFRVGAELTVLFSGSPSEDNYVEVMYTL